MWREERNGGWSREPRGVGGHRNIKRLSRFTWAPAAPGGEGGDSGNIVVRAPRHKWVSKNEDPRETYEIPKRDVPRPVLGGELRCQLTCSGIGPLG
jgi:hypothetical protein